MNIRDVENRMRSVLLKLGIDDFRVRWIPEGNPKFSRKRGYVDLKSRTIFIYDRNEDEAWSTFLHELLEIRLRRLTNLYRRFINSLLDILDDEVYRRKEDFLNEIPQILSLVEEARRNEGEKRKG